MTSPNKTSAIAFPDSAPGKPEKMIALTLSLHGRLTTAGALITTIIFLFTLAHFSINSFPLWNTSKSSLSPIVFSTLKYSSPEMDLTKIIATSESLAALTPPSISSVAFTCTVTPFISSSI